MKNIQLITLLLLVSINVLSQEVNYLIPGITNKTLASTDGSIKIDEGKAVTISQLRFTNVPDNNGAMYVKLNYVVDYNGMGMLIKPSDIKKITFDNPSTNAQLWQIISIENNLDANYLQNGYQYELRKDLEDETIEFIQNIEKYNGFFDDEFLNDYLQTILYKIHPIALGYGRPGNLNVKVLKSSDPNAFCTPTGTIIVTTGLLSTMKSEDELYGVLAHEVAHFVFDHQVENINKETQRQKRAEFWSGVSTALAAAADVYIASKNDYYPVGTITTATAILSTSIATSINNRLGSKYSIQQEIEADNISVRILTFLKKEPKALSVALSRIKNYCIINRDFIALSGGGTHPSLNERINNMGASDPGKIINKKYDKFISLVNTYNSINEYNLSHFETALSLVNRNIEAGVGIEDDLILKAMCLRTLYDTPEKNKEVLDLLSQARTLNIVPNSYVSKQEGITLLRLGKATEANAAFKAYLNNLESQNDKSEYVLSEIDWTRKMIYKASSL
jgi:beta-barrel assembly-enhancing protease